MTEQRGRGRRKALVHVLLALVGIAAMALLARSVGAHRLLAIVRASARWLPVLFGLDVLRLGFEAAATWALSARVRALVRLPALCRVHLVANAVSMVMPAGRAAGEAVKAAMLSRFIGVPDAAAVGAAGQATAMLGGVLIAVPCVAAALLLTGLSPLAGAFALYAGGAAAFFALFQIACRRREIGGFVLRRFARAGQATAAFHDAIAGIPVFPPAATAAAFVSRSIQVLELGVLLHALGGRRGLGGALVSQGVSMVGGSLGDLVPGQLGATDGAFALAAPVLGITVADGVAMAVLLHCVQLAWAAIGWTVPLWWKSEAR